MKCRLIVSILIVGMMTFGCSREVSSVRFYPQDAFIEETETETETQEEQLYFKLSYDNENYYEQNIIKEVSEDDLKAESVTEFQIKIPENAFLNDFCLYQNEMYYTYHFAYYEMEQFEENNIIEHTEELYTRVMSYNYTTGETRCVYEIDVPGLFIGDIRLEKNIIVLDKYYYSDMEIIYGEADIDEGLRNRGRVTDIINLETGAVLQVNEGVENGVLVDLTPHPYLVFSDYKTAFYKYDYATGKTTTLIDNMDSARIFCLDDNVAHLIEYEDYKKVVMYDYEGEYIYSFTTNMPYIFYVLVSDDNVVITAENFDNESVFVVLDQNGEDVYMVRYNPMISNVVCSGDKIYTGDYGNNGVSVFDITNKKVSRNYYGEGELSLFYSSTGGVYTRKGQYRPAVVKDGNQIIEFAVFND